MAGERSADEIQRDIEASRAALARTIDQIAYRTNPKRIANNGKQAVLARLNSTEGRIAIGVVGGLLVVLIVRRARKH